MVAEVPSVGGIPQGGVSAGTGSHGPGQQPVPTALAAPFYAHLPPQVLPMRLGGAAAGSPVSPVGPAKQAASYFQALKELAFQRADLFRHKQQTIKYRKKVISKR